MAQQLEADMKLASQKLVYEGKLEAMMKELSQKSDELKQLRHIGLSGQMHGSDPLRWD